MKKRLLTWITLAVLIGAMLVGAYLIVEKNNRGSEVEKPAEFFH